MENGKWKMCVDYTDLNWVFPNDACSRYNQIPMVEIDNKNIVFMNKSTIKILLFQSR